MAAAGAGMSRRDVDGIKRQLRIDHFLPGQLECIDALVFRRLDTWCQVPCGGGKTAIFAAALLILKGIGILVEPLHAIMATMAPYLRDRGIKVLVLNAASRAEFCARLRKGVGQGQG